jgi:hypothetical protein
MPKSVSLTAPSYETSTFERRDVAVDDLQVGCRPAAHLVRVVQAGRASAITPMASSSGRARRPAWPPS